MKRYVKSSKTVKEDLQRKLKNHKLSFLDFMDMVNDYMQLSGEDKEDIFMILGDTDTNN